MRRISLKNCPYCGCSKIYVSSSKVPWQIISVVFMLRLVRCHVCMRRSFRPIFLFAAENPARNISACKVGEVRSPKKKERVA
jgi:hypothetical protein